MLPSRFFLHAIQVILDDPHSIATINSFGISYIFYVLSFLANYLIVEFDIDIGVLVPASLGESVFIELLEAFQFAFQIGRTTQIDDMVNNSRHHLYSAIG